MVDRKIEQAEVNTLSGVLVNDENFIENWKELCIALGIPPSDYINWRRQVAMGNMSTRDLTRNILTVWYGRHAQVTYKMLSDALGKAGFVNLESKFVQNSKLFLMLTHKTIISDLIKSTYKNPGKDEEDERSLKKD